MERNRTNSFPFGSWIHLILVDGTKLKFFITNEETTTSINAKGTLTGDSTLFLGGRDSFGSGFYEGRIEDFRFYGHALSPDQRERAYLGLGSAFVTSFGEEYSFQIDSLRGPTDFNASGLPPGLEIDQKRGLIFGSAEQVGDYNVTLAAFNSSGRDEDNVTLYVSKGEQSIIRDRIGLLRYGDPPVDLNWTATSGLPVQIEILEGNESVELNSTQMPCTLTVLKPGLVKLRATQPANNSLFYRPAEKIDESFVVAKKNWLFVCTISSENPSNRTQSLPTIFLVLFSMIMNPNSFRRLLFLLLKTDHWNHPPLKENMLLRAQMLYLVITYSTISTEC